MNQTTASQKELEAAIEAVAARERKRQSRRALIVVGCLVLFAIGVLALNVLLSE